MKHLYKIGRLFLVSEKLPANYEPFLLPGTFCDEQATEFTDAAGVPVKKPFGIDPEKNVLFLNFISGTADLTSAARVTDLRQMSIWRSADNTQWFYISRFSQSWMSLSCDYSHAAVFSVERSTKLVDLAVECKLIRLGYVIMHAACIEVKDKAVLFSAPSGVGKSTRADRWVEACGAEYISGDRPIIDTMFGTAMGSPWDGKEAVYRNVTKPVQAIHFIHRAAITKFTRLTTDEMRKLLPAQTFIPMWDPSLVMEVYTGIKRIAKMVTSFRLECDQTVEAARECCRILFPGEAANARELLSQMKALDVPQSHYKYHVDNLLDLKAGKLGIPRHGTFELTPLCNLDCKMCYVHMHRAELNGVQLLSTQQWKRIMKEAYEAGMVEATLTGGECLTHPEFEELYLFLQSMGVEVTVFTNGLLLDEARAKFLKDHTVHQIQVTLYGSCDDAYEKVTGVRCFEQVYRNILYAKQIGLPIHLAVTPNAFSFDDIRSLLELIESIELPYKLNPMLSLPRKETNRVIQDLSAEQYVELYKIQARLQSRFLQPVSSSELPEPNQDVKVTRGIRCNAGRCVFCVTWKGELAPCVALTDMSRPLADGGFSKAWESVNHQVSEVLLPGECQTCAYRQHCNQCLANHYDAGNPGRCNKRICEKAKLMAEAGVWLI